LRSEVRPRPFEQDDDAVAKADQEQNVDDDPQKPSDEAGDAQEAEVRHRRRLADRRQIPLVHVVKRLGGLPGDRTDDVVGRDPALLHGGGCKPGNRLSRLLVAQRCEIADHEGFAMTRHREILLHQNAARSIERNTERLGQR
jgi:hypothetical protein